MNNFYEKALACSENNFGELLRATGPARGTNAFRFSSKYQDDETDLVYYGYRYYNPSAGDWVGRDPLADPAFHEGLSRCSGNSCGHVRTAEYVFLSNDALSRVDPHGLIQWQTAKWFAGPHPLARGQEDIQVNDYQVDTDKGSPIAAWKPVDGRTYDCHGLTFGGVTAAGGPYSPYGNPDVYMILLDEWVPICCARAGHMGGEKASGIVVFTRGKEVRHSGLVATAVLNRQGGFDETRSFVYSKWGVAEARPNFRTFQVNAAYYHAKYSCFVKKGDPRLGEITCCPPPGDNEVPPPWNW